MKNSKTFLIAPDSFKGAMSSKEICDTAEEAILKESPTSNVIKVPLADGGEGTVEALVLNTSGTFVDVKVTNPIGQEIVAQYGILGNGTTAVIEMAAASGLPLVPKDQRDPSVTTTYGTGELIKDAIDRGCKKIILGIGGSATNDCGVGAMQALGFSFKDKFNKEVLFGCSELSRVVKIDTRKKHSKLEDIEFLVACDVDNPLLGPKGATYTYAPQKGASKEMLPVLECSIEHISKIIESELGISVKETPGAGAAGGLGAGIMAFLGGKLTSGIDLVINNINFEEHFKSGNVDIVITGEGAMDYQTAYGKLPVGVASAVSPYSVPVVAIVGTMGEGAEDVLDKGINSIFSIVDGPKTLEASMEGTKEQVYKTVRMITRLYTAK